VDAEDATKRALEAIHELADCLTRGEWSQQGCGAGTIGLWHGVIGTRNAGHVELRAFCAFGWHGQIEAIC
jgi:hypothetical protein